MFSQQLQSSLHQNSGFEQNMKRLKKCNDKFSYPHPILKSFTSVSQQSLSIPPSAYQNFHTSDPKTISNKLLRSTHISPLLGSSFSLLLHPLHPKLEVERSQSKFFLECIKCKAYLNSASLDKLSLFRHQCKFCGCLVQSQFESGRYVDLNLIDKIEDQANLQSMRDQDEPAFLFVVQASEYLHRKNIVTEIFQCLRALCPPLAGEEVDKSMSEQTQKSCGQIGEFWGSNMKLGFILFDGQRNYIINMSTKQLVIVCSHEFDSAQQFPLSRQELLQPLCTIDLQWLQQTITTLMYESFMIKTSCLTSTLKICNLLARTWHIQSKIFALSYDANMLGEPLKKERKRKAPTFQISPYVQLVVFSSGLYEYLDEMGLHQNLSRYFQYNKLSQSDIYYEVYHSLTQETYYQVQMQVFTSGLIAATKTLQTFPVLNSNRSLVLDFSLPSKLNENSQMNGKQSLSTQCIQIRLTFQKFHRIITYSLPTIGVNLRYEPYVLNDETFFYVMVFKFLTDPKCSLNKAIRLKCKQIVQRIIKAEDEQFSIPKNLIHFFMYSFIVVEYQLCDKRNVNFLFEKTCFFRQGLETIVKKLYPKVYEFHPELKPLKFRPKSFLDNTVKLIDNGRCLALIVGDQVSTDVLIQLFDKKTIDDVLELKEIPVLETDLNKKLQRALSLLKQSNQLYYLTVKIIKLDSSQFEEEFGRFLYIDEDHRKFFLKLLKE